MFCNKFLKLLSRVFFFFFSWRFFFVQHWAAGFLFHVHIYLGMVLPDPPWATSPCKSRRRGTMWQCGRESVYSVPFLGQDGTTGSHFTHCEAQTCPSLDISRTDSLLQQTPWNLDHLGLTELSGRSNSAFNSLLGAQGCPFPLQALVVIVMAEMANLDISSRIQHRTII